MNRSVSRRALLRQAAAALAGATLMTPAGAAVPEAPFQAAFRLFQQAAQGDGGAVDRAADAFGALLRDDPAHPLLLAYTGAATAMRATTTWLPWRRIAHAEDGLALIDKALVRLAPAHDAMLVRGTPVGLETRFVAASTFLRLPEFFRRRVRGERLLEEVQKHPAFAASPAAFRDAVRQRAAAHGAAR